MLRKLSKFLLLILSLDVIIFVNSFSFNKNVYKSIKSSTFLRISTPASSPIKSDSDSNTDIKYLLNDGDKNENVKSFNSKTKLSSQTKNDVNSNAVNTPKTIKIVKIVMKEINRLKKTGEIID